MGDNYNNERTARTMAEWSELQKRLDSVDPQLRGWYRGYTDALFWNINGPSGTSILPHEVWDSYRHWLPLDPGLLWDVITEHDEGRIAHFRIQPQDNPQSVILEGYTTEQDETPDWELQPRSEFISAFNEQSDIINFRYSYIPGANR